MAARKIVQMAAGSNGVYALADDGTMWRRLSRGQGDDWEQVPGLPEAARCTSNIDRDGDNYWCELSEGHAGNHADGGRTWVNLAGGNT